MNKHHMKFIFIYCFLLILHLLLVRSYFKIFFLESPFSVSRLASQGFEVVTFLSVFFPLVCLHSTHLLLYFNETLSWFNVAGATNRWCWWVNSCVEIAGTDFIPYTKNRDNRALLPESWDVLSSRNQSSFHCYRTLLVVGFKASVWKDRDHADTSLLFMLPLNSISI